MSHPKGLTVDNRGNIYIADTMNMAIRKISDTGIVQTSEYLRCFRRISPGGDMTRSLVTLTITESIFLE